MILGWEFSHLPYDHGCRKNDATNYSPISLGFLSLICVALISSLTWSKHAKKPTTPVLVKTSESFGVHHRLQTQAILHLPVGRKPL